VFEHVDEVTEEVAKMLLVVLVVYFKKPNSIIISWKVDGRVVAVV
jgi:3-deoxy-D-arabino-heptulosonate 7-phosphate (DAHP) synthase